MTGDPLRKLQVGDRLASIPAAAWNAFIDAARYVRRLQASGDAPAPFLDLAPGQILIQNASGADRDRFDVLQLADPVITAEISETEFLRSHAMTGVTPTGDWKGAFVVLADPIPAGQIGRAWIDGVCPAWVKGGGGWADTESGEAAWLKAGDVGNARILWSAAGEDERWAYVRLNDPRSFVLVKTVAGPDDTPYPEEGDNPTVYRCRILSGVSFPKTPGAQVLGYAETGRYDYVFNLVSNHFIEEGSIVGALPLDGQLYTMDKLFQESAIILGSVYGGDERGLQKRAVSDGEKIGDPSWDTHFNAGFRRMRTDAEGNVHTLHFLSNTGRIGYTVHTPDLVFVRYVEQAFVDYPNLDAAVGTHTALRPLGEIDVTADGLVYVTGAGHESGPVLDDAGIPTYYRVHEIQWFDSLGVLQGAFDLVGTAIGGGVNGCEVLANGMAVRADGNIVVCASIANIGPDYGLRYSVQCYSSAGSRLWEYDIRTEASGLLYRKPGEIAVDSSGNAFVAFENSVVAVDTSGSHLWTYDGAGATDRVFTVCTDADDGIYCYGFDATQHTVRKLSPADGSVLWTYQTANAGQLPPYAGSGTHGETVSWASTTAQENGIFAQDGAVYFVVMALDDLTQPTLFKLNAATGAERYTKATGRNELQGCARAGRWPLFG